MSTLLALPCSLRISVLRPALTAAAVRSSTSTHFHTSTRASTSTHFRTFSTTTPDLAEENDQKHSSVNHEEVSHFNTLASSWWDPHGSSRLLHLMNPLRHRFIKKCRESSTHESSAKLKYLDVGCGGGIFAESAARLYDTESVMAIDPTPGVLAVAQKHQRQDPLLLEPGRLVYKQTAIEGLPLPASPETGYDIITVFEVVEHIRKPSVFLQSCLEHVKPGGWLIGSTITRTNVSWFTTKLVAEDLLRIVPRGTHNWNQYIQPDELFQWAKVQPELDVNQSGRGWEVMGVVYVPGLGWKEVGGSEEWGNYFFGMRKCGGGD